MAKKYGIPFLLESQQNRYPVLLIDELVELDPGKSVVAIKNYTYNEWFFPGHFEGNPSVPGFVQLESLAQSFIMTFLSLPEHKGKPTAFSKLNNVNFTRKIVPGESLLIRANLQSFKFGVASGTAEGYVDGELACRADLTVVLPDVISQYLPKSNQAQP